MRRGPDRVYGEAFAAIYNRRWGAWCRMLWPLIARQLPATTPENARWLDLCCGGGILLRLAAARGYSVMGIDQSPFQLQQAREAVPSATLLEGNVTALKLNSRFEVVTCVFDSLNYLLTAKEINRLFRAVRRHLLPGGLFIFDVKTAYGFSLEAPVAFEYSEGRVAFAPRYAARRRLYSLHVSGEFVDNDRLRDFEELHMQRAHKPATLGAALTRAGFAWRECDAESGGPVLPETRRVIYVARTDQEYRRPD